MIEDEDGQVEVSQSGEALLYDYFKHLTSLCLVSLGGVLALADRAVRPGLLIGAIGVISLAALLSFGGAAEIVRARFERKPMSKHLGFYRNASPASLSVGLGMFLYLFGSTLK